MSSACIWREAARSASRVVLIRRSSVPCVANEAFSANQAVVGDPQLSAAILDLAG
jgi:hypothetical protein